MWLQIKTDEMRIGISGHLRLVNNMDLGSRDSNERQTILERLNTENKAVGLRMK